MGVRARNANRTTSNAWRRVLRKTIDDSERKGIPRMGRRLGETIHTGRNAWEAYAPRIAGRFAPEEVGRSVGSGVLLTSDGVYFGNFGTVGGQLRTCTSTCSSAGRECHPSVTQSAENSRKREENRGKRRRKRLARSCPNLLNPFR